MAIICLGTVAFFLAYPISWTWRYLRGPRASVLVYSHRSGKYTEISLHFGWALTLQSSDAIREIIVRKSGAQSWQCQLVCYRDCTDVISKTAGSLCTIDGDWWSDEQRFVLPRGLVAGRDFWDVEIKVFEFLGEDLAKRSFSVVAKRSWAKKAA